MCIGDGLLVSGGEKFRGGVAAEVGVGGVLLGQ